MTLEETPKLRIAIIGAGLVGTFASVALSSLPNVKVTTFEKSSTPRESGALISLTTSGLQILDKFIDIDEIAKISYTNSLEDRFVYRDWKTSEIITKQETITTNDVRYATAKTQRSAVLKLLLSKVPKDSIKYGYKLEDAIFNDGTITLKFEGIEKSEEFDLVVAADGIYSKLRRKIHPDKVLGYRGSVAYRNVFPASLVESIDGEVLKDNTLAFKSPDGIAFFSKLGLDTYGLVLSVPEKPEVIERLRWDNKLDDNDVQRLKERFKEWPKVLRDLIDVSPYFNAFPLESEPWLEHLAHDDKLAFIGDAAHPTSGAFGAGAGFGYGDVWALYRGLQDTASNTPKRKRAKLNNIEYKGENNDSYDVPTALFLFDETRRYFLKDVYEEIDRSKKNSAYEKAGETNDEITERLIQVNSDSSWLAEHNVELEYQRTRSKNISRLYKSNKTK